MSAAPIGNAVMMARNSFFICILETGVGARRAVPLRNVLGLSLLEPVLETQLELPRARSIEPREVVGRINLVRAGIPLRHRAVIEHVEDVQSGFGALLSAEPEFAREVQLHVLLVFIACLTVAADRIGGTWQRRRAAEPEGGRQRVRLS